MYTSLLRDTEQMLVPALYDVTVLLIDLIGKITEQNTFTHFWCLVFDQGCSRTKKNSFERVISQLISKSAYVFIFTMFIGHKYSCFFENIRA